MAAQPPPTDPLQQLKASFNAKDATYWGMFDAALTANKTTLEAQRGADKPFLMAMLSTVGVGQFHCGDLADALLAYFAGMPSPKKSPRPVTPRSFRFTAKVLKGASYQNLRRFVFEAAEKTYAHDGTIIYSSPVTADSDLDVELRFKAEEHAMEMRRLLVEALREVWCDTTIPMCAVEVCEGAVQKPVFANHYDAKLSPTRTAWSKKKKGRRSAATTVLDEAEIDLESVVDKTTTNCQFEKCHINAALKGKRGDTEGNWIPLPSDWHDLFDADTIDRKACVSILADKTLDEKKSDGRQAVNVHVYFAPHCIETEFRCKQLRGGRLIRKGTAGGAVFEVKVWKREVDKFVEELKTRHDTVLQAWSSVP